MKELLKVLEFTADRTQALADSQSVAGEPLHVGDVTLIPVSSISCGFAGGGSCAFQAGFWKSSGAWLAAEKTAPAARTPAETITKLQAASRCDLISQGGFEAYETPEAIKWNPRIAPVPENEKAHDPAGLLPVRH